MCIHTRCMLVVEALVVTQTHLLLMQKVTKAYALGHMQGLYRLEKYLNIQDCVHLKILENKICIEKHLKNSQRP